MKISAVRRSLKLSAHSASRGVRKVLASIGSEAVAGATIAIRIMMFTLMPAWGMSNAAATLVGQNLGAGKPARSEAAVWAAGKFNALFQFGVGVVFWLFSAQIIGIFTQDPKVLQTGTMALRIIGTGYVFYGVGMVMIQALNGAGDTRTPTLINLIGFWLFQIPLAIFLAIYCNMGATGSFIAIPVAETAIALAAWILFRRGRWKTVKV